MGAIGYEVVFGAEVDGGCVDGRSGLGDLAEVMLVDEFEFGAGLDHGDATEAGKAIEVAVRSDRGGGTGRERRRGGVCRIRRRSKLRWR